ncbi:hypothetical protein HDU97_000671 [Phlyctochytrium planicorne]|nr:hypothetical protein HDU97_000671 [Phlyctochytrium planicorne]
MPAGILMAKEEDVVTAVAAAPVTFDRNLPTQLETRLKNPGLPRANTAPSAEKPESQVEPLAQCDQKSVLQQHIHFFDRDKNGIIYPWETYAGFDAPCTRNAHSPPPSFRALGWNFFASGIFTMFINGTMSYGTLDSWIPNPLFPIYVKNAHRLKHGSDSEVYDTEGRFVPEKFEEIFSKYDKDGKKALTLSELWKFTEAVRNAYDPYGWFQIEKDLLSKKEAQKQAKKDSKEVKLAAKRK